MRRRRPRSTLFPYTTLFRSIDGRREAWRSGGGAEGTGRANCQSGSRGRRRPRFLRRIAARNARSNSRVEAIVEDRKSTRLNSSHVEISYAVFCLKKKNIE